ncbi:uncharacterized protein MELLADRAFT_89247 [Melampsora larici-populina 98AG31]|uniref:Uncharacterized protein n=1 Tax=Melampsora larici-populina (strain 98AG31 / pathotype 3-4-7) TaxID=747676 RepID=F4R5H6_MELLP|nr:uncharacterized protein MELLADRAFT_89247 [Melampsora larici-populina 98AG31]EGG12049.1 hypothetical protein MELLADRAFT_89247 [Melampsora larici-populina 98AG31]
MIRFLRGELGNGRTTSVPASLIIPAAIDAHRFCESTQSDTAIFSRLCPAIKGKRRSASIIRSFELDTGYEIAVASESLAVLALSDDLAEI